MFDKKYDAEALASVYKSVYEKKLDPVGQEDKDIDNDGDHDKSDKYLLNRRKVRGAAIKTRKEEVELDENRRAARSAGGYKDDSKKQTDPSKDGFTGISGSIKDIMRQNREIEAREKKKTKKEEVETVDEGMKKARENVGASTCWDGYKAKGTKKKNGKEVPNCVKEEDLSEGERAGLGGNRGLAQGGWRTAARGDETSQIQKKQDAQRDKANAAGARGPEFTKSAQMANLKRTMPTNMRNSYEPEGEDLSEGEWFGGLKKRFQGAADAYNRSRGVPSPRQAQGGSITVRQTKSAEKTTPYSKTDSGNLTDFGAGGGKAKMKKTGMSASEVEQQGRANKGTRLPQIDDHSKYHKNSYEPEGEMVEEGKKELSREKRNKMFRRAGNLSREALQGGDKGSEAHKKSGKIVKALNKDAEENNRNDVREETLRDIYESKKKGLWDNIHAKRERGESPAKPGDKDYPKTLKVEGLEEAAPALVGVLAKMAAKKAAVHVAKKGAEKVKDKMGKLLKGDEEEEG